jgi:hypothetical protein
MRRNRLGLVLFLVAIWLTPANAQREGLISRIEDPGQFFQDQRRNWLGKRIRFLPCPNPKGKNPYFDWYYDPFDLDHSKPKKEDLLFCEGTIEEVWLGQIHITKETESYWRMGFFWKVRLEDGRSVFFWDDGESGPFNFGFVDDYEEARSRIGQKLWARDRHILYSLDSKHAVRLKHLEPVYLKDVQWGDYGNFPLKFILATSDGRKGYVLSKNYAEFIKDWYTYDPRDRFRYVRLQDWQLIERRQLRKGMTPELVILSWGEPLRIEMRRSKDGAEQEVWVYEGVADTEYYLFFKKGKLQNVRWEKKK